MEDPLETIGAGSLECLKDRAHFLAQLQASFCANLTSPTGRNSSGPSVRYSVRTSMNTVERTLWPLLMSTASSASRYC